MLGAQIRDFKQQLQAFSNNMIQGLFLEILLGDSEFDSFTVGLIRSLSKFLNMIPILFSSCCLNKRLDFLTCKIRVVDSVTDSEYMRTVFRRKKEGLDL